MILRLYVFMVEEGTLYQFRYLLPNFIFTILEPMEVDQPQKTSSSSTAPTQALISTKTPLLPEEMVDFGDGEIKKWKDHREWRKKNHWERWKLKKYRQNMKRPRVNESMFYLLSFTRSDMANFKYFI